MHEPRPNAAPPDRIRRAMTWLAGLSVGEALAQPADADTAHGRTRTLVAVFSRSGNTRVIAGLIQRACRGTLFAIEPARPYPDEYLATVAQARQERDGGIRPTLAGQVDGMRSYDTVFLGFPIWGETAPPVIRSFLASHDLAGKRLVPFVTHGGYGLGDSLDVLTRHAPEARLTPGFTMQADQERQTMERVDGWLRAARFLMPFFFLIPFIVTLMAFAPDATARDAPAEPVGAEPLMIESQGSFAVGGTVLRAPPDPTNPDSAQPTLRGDHARVFYQIPVNPRPLPLVLWHGFGQFGKTWETTADGREGFQTIFLRRRFPVYVVDQPRRGGAGCSTVAASIAATPDEPRWFDMFRIGRWPDYFPGVQFARDAETLDQYFRQMVPDTGPLDARVASDAIGALFQRIGPGVLVTHSHSGGMGWTVAMENPQVRAVVAYEPGSGFVFPDGEVPPPMPSATGPLAGVPVTLDAFRRLTRIPIVVYYGDNIPDEPSPRFGEDNWRVRLAMARLWVAAINRHGGDATLVHLPSLGIHGNTHFPFSDLNNVQIADLMQNFLSRKGLDQRQGQP